MAQSPPHTPVPEAAAPAVQHRSDPALCCFRMGTQGLNPGYYGHIHVFSGFQYGPHTGKSASRMQSTGHKRVEMTGGGRVKERMGAGIISILTTEYTEEHREMQKCSVHSVSSVVFSIT